MPAPDRLVDEADRIGRCLGVTVPDLVSVPGIGTPLLWCLGRPKLLLPLHLVKTLSLERWRGILTHELAHLRRGDHWVARLELVAGLFWWWNPIYWLARARVDAEAELACDAWVVWAMPKDRLTYAEVLFDICASLSLVRPAKPTLGVAGSGRFFERRLTMILNDRVSCRLSPLGLLGAALLALLALPSWSSAGPAASGSAGDLAAIASDPATSTALPFTDADDDDDDDDAKAVKRRNHDRDDDADDDDDDDDDDDADDDDDDDGDADRAAARAKARADAARDRANAAMERAEALRKRAEAIRARSAGNKGKDKLAKPVKEKADADLERGKIAGKEPRRRL